MLPEVSGDARNVGIVKGGVDLIEHEEWGGLETGEVVERQQAGKRRERRGISTKRKGNLRGQDTSETHLWIAKRRARAATVCSPPDSWSMSLNRFIGGMAWYLIPAR